MNWHQHAFLLRSIDMHGGGQRGSITEIAAAVIERGLGRLTRGDCISTAEPRPTRRRKSTSIYAGSKKRRGRESLYREMPQGIQAFQNDA